MKSGENRPNSLWSIGTMVEFLDAWGKNPVQGRVIRHYNEFEVLIEDRREVRHFGQTWRIVSTVEPAITPSEKSTINGMFEDLLG